jgi:hypothetical protein
METSKNAIFLGNKINSNFLCYLHSFEWNLRRLLTSHHSQTFVAL